MKKVLKPICTFFIALFTLLSVACFLYSYLTSPKLLLGVVKRTNYYEEAYKEITKNLDQQTINDQLKESVHSIVTKEKIENDIDRMIHSLFNKKNIEHVIEVETKLSIDLSFKEALDGQSFEQSSFDQLVKTLTNSYMKDLFPYAEYRKLQNKFLAVSYLLPMGIFFLLMAFLTALVSTLIYPERKKESFFRANIFSGVLMICPYCFCHLYGLFKNFYYSNLYFSLLIRNTFYTMINILGLIGALLLVVTFSMEFLEFYKKNKKKEN